MIKPILYTDEINGKQTCRDDLWLVDTTLLDTLKVESDMLRYLLRQIVDALPTNRDWLNPVLERAALDVLKENA